MTTARQLGLFDPSSPLALKSAPVRRDQALEQHERRYAREIAAATAAAHALADRGEIVTGPRIAEEMRRRGDGHWLVGDTRWLGSVCRPEKGWTNTGRYIPDGSKGRPCPIWVRR